MLDHLFHRGDQLTARQGRYNTNAKPFFLNAEDEKYGCYPERRANNNGSVENRECESYDKYGDIHHPLRGVPEHKKNNHRPPLECRDRQQRPGAPRPLLDHMDGRPSRQQFEQRQAIEHVDKRVGRELDDQTSLRRPKQFERTRDQQQGIPRDYYVGQSHLDLDEWSHGQSRKQTNHRLDELSHDQYRGRPRERMEPRPVINRMENEAQGHSVQYGHIPERRVTYDEHLQNHNNHRNNTESREQWREEGHSGRNDDYGIDCHPEGIPSLLNMNTADNRRLPGGERVPRGQDGIDEWGRSNRGERKAQHHEADSYTSYSGRHRAVHQGDPMQGQ